MDSVVWKLKLSWSCEGKSGLGTQVSVISQADTRTQCTILNLGSVWQDIILGGKQLEARSGWPYVPCLSGLLILAVLGVSIS